MRDLMRRSELAEREAWKDLYRHAPEALQRALGLRAEDRGGVTFLSAPRLEHLLFNRAIGLGSAGSTDEESAERAVAYYESRNIDRYWIHLGSSLRRTALPTHLRARGVLPYPRSWMKFARRAAPVDSAGCELRIREARPSDAPRIAEIAAPAFDTTAEAGGVFSGAIGAPGWHYYVAEDHECIVAASALYVRERDALLVFAATAPEARRRGCQRALMATRLEQSQRLACDYVFTETGLPVAGEDASSYRNMLRVGFEELYVRDNFAPEGTGWLKESSSVGTTRSNVLPERSTAPRKAAARSGI